MSYSNINARLGVGTTNLVAQGEYPLTRISNDYMLLLALYRGNWIIRKVVDVMAEDMLKAWPRITSQVDPQAIKKFERVVAKTATKAKTLEALKWGRLFGGAVAIIALKGHKDLAKPLNIDDIEPGSYCGLIPLDRWSGVSAGGELIDDIENAAEFGLPRYYQCDLGSHGKSLNVHHSRLLRFAGRDLPNWEKQVQQYWGMSEVELVYDELRKWDYANWSSASLISRANIWTIKEPELAQMLSGAGLTQAAAQAFLARLQAISDGMSNQGLFVLGKDGELQNHSQTFSGISDLLNTYALNMCGATEYTMSKLFGRTSTGLGQSGEGDLQMYYDTVQHKRERELRPQMEKLFPVIAMSAWGEVPEDLDYEFPPVRTLSDKDQADLTKSFSDSALAGYNAGAYGRKTLLKDLRQISEATGGVVYSNITDEMIDAAEDEVTPHEMSAEKDPLEATEREFGANDAAAKMRSRLGLPNSSATDAEWQESEHPRVEGGPNAGEFASKSGTSPSSVKSGALIVAPDRKDWPEHIKQLKLPPAWKDVRINPDPEAALQAVGRDAKGRAQYVYSKEFQNTQAEAKFARIKELDRKFDKIRRQNAERMASENPKTRDNAECAALVMAMGIRPGSDADTKAKVKAYGATTLEGRHVVSEDDQVYLRFTGKKGVSINLPVSDPALAAMLEERAKQAGADGKLFPGVSDKSLLDYTHTLNGGGFKTKDFRTLLGTRGAIRKIESMPPPKTEKEYKKLALEVAKSVSSKLGNTPTVALQSYINPTVFAAWRAQLAA